ncbi:MAG: FHA domain-containing protein [Myxococcales bacterium]|nr:FHA domain-containing protein [Myxococcales bacterium]
MSYVILYGQHHISLRPGRFVIGRAANAELAIDDPLVSRQHAVLIVTEAGVSIEDLGSRNGVSVNDARVSGRQALKPGDRIKIGSQELSLVGDAPAPQSRARAAPTARFSVFGVMGTLADKAFGLGRADEAERVLAAPLEEILTRAEAGKPADAETNAQAAAFATRLALTTGKGSWVDYVVRLYLALASPLPGPVVDALHEALRKVGAIDLSSLRRYVEGLRSMAPDLGPSERFLVSRIEGLERVAAAR